MSDDPGNPAGLLDALGGVTVACIGDVMLDRFVYGTVDRISPEAPIPVLNIIGETEMLGGAGNVIRNLRSLGAGAIAVTVVGDDDEGRIVRGLVDDLVATPQYLIVDRRRRTSVKCRYIAGSQQLLRTDAEDRVALDVDVAAAILAAAQEAIAAADAVIVSDYGKGVIGPELMTAIVAAAADADIPVVVDPVGSDWRRYRGATLLTPNRKELVAAAAMHSAADAADADFVAAARAVIAACGVAQVLVTRGAQGMTLIAGEAEPLTLPARAREVFDVSGAGDTVAAAIAAGLAAGLPAAAAMELANAAAGVVVGKIGTATAERREILDQLTLAAVRERSEKIKSDAELDELVAQWRRQGLTVGFTNGCFDVVHPGHVSLLSQAAASCDRLIVALNNDASVQELKGPDRPVQTETARARVIASLADVDAVVLFGDDTPLELIRRIRPDTLVKGADYTVDTVVGADFVKSYGGEIVLARLEPGYSTSAAIARMAK